MNAPICDFVSAYEQRRALRLHMPGHKGRGGMGVEKWDITEIDGADVLYQGRGVIRQSQENAARLFGTGRTLYSTEGSSLCIRAMLYLACLWAARKGQKPSVLAARNAHKVFIHTAALLDMEVDWLFPEESSLLACRVTPAQLETALSKGAPTAVYITSPDYLGNRADIAALAQVCHRYGALLLVDNAHGTYLKFLSQSEHPMDLGADLCCDSAHKTLPVLTGGAYLHVAREPFLMEQADNAMALFASTSPSYLILQSLDRANQLLDGAFPQKLRETAVFLQQCRLSLPGYIFVGDEPLKWTLRTKPMGYRGEDLATLLSRLGVECEFADPDFVVMMFSPLNTPEELSGLVAILQAIPAREPIAEQPPALPQPRRRMRPHDALMSPREQVPLCRAAGRILAAASITCPPAVPVVALGEEISPEAVACMAYYHIETVTVAGGSTPCTRDCDAGEGSSNRFSAGSGSTNFTRDIHRRGF